MTVNDRVVARCDIRADAFLLARAGRPRRPRHGLRPGDVLGSGTLAGGCLLELGPIDGHWIEPGDVVVLTAPGLGTLRTPVE